ncbi:MAG: hypothetical protein KBD78_08210 [Oligoflexales bacterium]|nr:hypothetical protein [Oligoflexales bacterium]
MKKFRSKYINLLFYSALFSAAALLTSCSADTNILGLMTDKRDLSTFDNELELARIRYDKGEFEQAQIHGEAALALEGDATEVRLLLGYIYMARAGADPFTIASTLSKDEEEEGESSSGVDAIGSLLLTDEEMLSLGELDESTPSLPIIIPGCAEEVRVDVERLAFIQRGISQVCSLVGESLRNSEDYRHDCTDLSAVSDEMKTRSYFLWGLLHLLEASMFQAVLGYSTTTSAKSNFELRVDALSSLDTSDVTQLNSIISQVESIDQMINNIFPSSSFCIQTQLTGILNDVLAAGDAFAKLPGLPASLSKSVTKLTDKINEYADNVEGGSDENKSLHQLKGLKGQFTSDAAVKVAATINALETSGQDISAAQRVELCASFESINETGSTETPALCQN